jgi:trans-2,3-dihydro-3-hydroxyanthranilate isomerase
MEGLTFYIVDVFAEKKYAGNQLAVVREAGQLSHDTMLAIAREMHFSETTFILSDEPRNGGFDVRIYTLDRELPFAGHPTLGTAAVIRNEILGGDVEKVVLNLRVGQIEVTADPEGTGNLWMRQRPPEFGATHEKDPVAEVLGLEPGDIDDRAPIQEVSTGTPVIIVPVMSLAAMKRIEVDYRKLVALPRDPTTTGLMPFCTETDGDDNDLHVRFFATIAGIPEDPATGSAVGCLAGYLSHHECLGGSRIDVRVEQGAEIGRPSLLHLKAAPAAEGIEVDVGGRVIRVAEGVLD